MQPNKIQPDKVQASIDISISIIRGIAFCSIVCCHIFQYLNIELAWWFNVGVQVFLCISGYLYGSKEPSPPIYFYKRRFKKILRPYYIVIIPVCVLYTLYAPDKINCLKIIHVLLVHGTLEGGGHLWFIATILMCYIITPLLFDLFNRDFSKFSFFMQCLAVNSVCLIFFGLYAPYFNAANIICYVIGFCLGFNEKKQIIKHSSIFLLISALTILNFPQIFIDYVLNLNFQGRIQFIYNVFCAFNHVWLGIFLFLLLKDHIIPRLLLKHTITYKLLQISDKYSYVGYLTHQFFILGPFSMMAITPYLIINLLIIICMIILSAAVVFKLDEQCDKLAVILHTRSIMH